VKNRKNIAVIGLGLIFLSCTSNDMAYAEDYAVIVGIDEYKQEGIKHLVGAKNDAVAYKKLLLLNGVKEKNIRFLDNKNATKKGIKKALRWVETSIHKGDRFYYFHAGHGTSLHDNRDYFDGTKLEHIKKTGVLLPYDYKDKDIDSLIISQNDLRPYFREIDKKISFGLIVFDACYSGFSYKGIGSSLKKNSLVSRDIPSLFGKIDLKDSNNYPYTHIYALTASDSKTKSYEDYDQRRGIFTMALEGCVFESQEIYKSGLEICLDRRYPKQTYKFKKPKNDNNPLFFNLKGINPIKKLQILSDIDISRFSKIANFVKKGVHDLELDLKNGVYILYSSGDLVGKFRDKKVLEKYLSNYRVIYQKQKGKKRSDIDIKVSYKNSNRDNDYIKKNSDIIISIKSSKKDYYLAIFSLNRKGKLFLIEPVEGYKRLKDYGEKIYAKTKPPIGTDFIKVLLFKKKNSLDKLKVDKYTGEVLNDFKQIGTILNTLNHSEFYEASKAIRVIEE
jgi:hypothetical protein